MARFLPIRRTSHLSASKRTSYVSAHAGRLSGYSATVAISSSLLITIMYGHHLQTSLYHSPPFWDVINKCHEHYQPYQKNVCPMSAFIMTCALIQHYTHDIHQAKVNNCIKTVTFSMPVVHKYDTIKYDISRSQFYTGKLF